MKAILCAMHGHDSMRGIGTIFYEILSLRTLFAPSSNHSRARFGPDESHKSLIKGKSLSSEGSLRRSIGVERLLMQRRPRHDIAAVLPGLALGMIEEAHGRLDRYVLFTRNGRIFARIHVIPANPRTIRQQEGRYRFRKAVQCWQNLDASEKFRWNGRAKNLSMSGYNLFIGAYMRQRAVGKVNIVMLMEKTGCILPIRESVSQRPLRILSAYTDGACGSTYFITVRKTHIIMLFSTGVHPIHRDACTTARCPPWPFRGRAMLSSVKANASQYHPVAQSAA